MKIVSIQINERLVIFVLSLCVTMLALGAWAGYAWEARRMTAGTGAIAAAGDPVPGEPKKPKAAPAALVRVDYVSQGVVEPTKPLSGSLVEVKRSTVASEVPGKIVDLPVEEGAPVIADKTLLARIDDTWCNIAISKIKAEIEAIRADLAYQQTERARLDDLLPLDAISQSEFDSNRAVIDRLQANLAEAEARLGEETEKKKRLMIFAPFDGSVIAKHAELGEQLSVGGPIVDIVSNGRIDARIMVPESMVGRLAVGQMIDLTVPSLPTGSESGDLQGAVVAINSYGDRSSRTFPVRIALDDQAGQLRSGMSVTAYLPLADASTELTVPKDAVLTEPDGSTVWVIHSSGDHDTVALPVPVRVKYRLRDVYCIEPLVSAGALPSGNQAVIRPGDTVVIEGAERLTPQVSVRIDPRDFSLLPIPGMHENGQQKAEN